VEHNSQEFYSSETFVVQKNSTPLIQVKYYTKDYPITNYNPLTNVTMQRSRAVFFLSQTPFAPN